VGRERGGERGEGGEGGCGGVEEEEEGKIIRLFQPLRVGPSTPRPSKSPGALANEYATCVRSVGLNVQLPRMGSFVLDRYYSARQDACQCCTARDLKSAFKRCGVAAVEPSQAL
jgi:hypothetical protein